MLAIVRHEYAYENSYNIATRAIQWALEDG